MRRYLKKRKTIPENIRFEKFFRKTSGCWLWLGYTYGRSDYGHFWSNGKMILAHRFSYELYKGPIPKGMQLDHVVCHVKKCVNPEHLEVVTARENTRRYHHQVRFGKK